MAEIDLEALAARVEKLEGPCRETDAEVARALGLTSGKAEWAPFGDDCAKKFTASLDAAMSLVSEGWSYWDIAMKRIGTGNDGARAEVSRLLEGQEDAVRSFARTPPLALASAALKARARLMEGEGE